MNLKPRARGTSVTCWMGDTAAQGKKIKCEKSPWWKMVKKKEGEWEERV